MIVLISTIFVLSTLAGTLVYFVEGGENGFENIPKSISLLKSEIVGLMSFSPSWITVVITTALSIGACAAQKDLVVANPNNPSFDVV